MTAASSQGVSGNVVPFASSEGDWTAAELARLAGLSRALEAQGATVEAAYGVSDAGDPWCVITDAADEVLIHVARIAGRFVIHDAAADAVLDGDTLWEALDRSLGQAWRDERKDGVVIPLHQAQTLLAVIAALVFEHETRNGEIGGSLSAPGHMTPAGGEAATAAVAVDPTADAPYAVAGSAESRPIDDPSHAAKPTVTPLSAEPAPATTPVEVRAAMASPAVPEAGHNLAGTERTVPVEDLALGQIRVAAGVGSTESDGPGVRTHGGVEVEVLKSGPGDERMVLAARTVVIGGPGHDVFVIGASTPAAGVEPPAGPGPPGSQGAAAPGVSGGVILDFTSDDALEFTTGRPVTVVSVTTVADVLSDLHGNPALAQLGVTPGERVGFDLNGDGTPDIYVLVAGPAAASLTVGRTFGVTPPPDHEPAADAAMSALTVWHDGFLFT